MDSQIKFTVIDFLNHLVIKSARVIEEERFWGLIRLAQNVSLHTKLNLKKMSRFTQN